MEDENPGDLIARIHQRTLDQLPDSEACCVICLDQIHEPCEATPCRHTDFDYLCLLQWLSRTPRCPLCVQPITGVKHQFDGKEVTTSVDPPQKPESNLSHPASASTPTQNDLFLNPYRFRNGRDRGRRRARPYAPSSASAGLGVESRKRVYQRGLYSKHVGSNRLSQYRELTPTLFNTDAQLVSRARTFLRRELQVFPFLTPFLPTDGSSSSSSSRRRADNAEFLMEYIIAVLKSVDLVGGRAEDLVADFLGREHTRLFLHELRAWLRSPFEKLEDWDRAVQYAEPSTSLSLASSSTESQSVSPARGSWRGRGDSWRPSDRDRRRKDIRRRAVHRSRSSETAQAD